MAGGQVTAQNEANPKSMNFAQLWVESFSSVLSQVAGKPTAFEGRELAEAAGVKAPETEDKRVHVIVVAGGPARGEMALSVPEGSASALAQIFTGQAPDAAAGFDAGSVVEELLRQVAGHVTTAAQSLWPKLTLTAALGPLPAWPSAASGVIHSVSGAEPEIEIEWRMSAALNTSMTAAQNQPEPAAAPSQTSSPDPARLGFFMDMALEVMLRFGGRDVLLKDILQLGPGSVLELDREIKDPADLVLDGKLIARGEVVMVDGNFGLRVTEVMDSAQNAPKAA